MRPMTRVRLLAAAGEAERQKMGVRGREHMRRDFSSKSVLDRIEALLAEAARR